MKIKKKKIHILNIKIHFFFTGFILFYGITRNCFPLFFFHVVPRSRGNIEFQIVLMEQKVQTHFKKGEKCLNPEN